MGRRFNDGVDLLAEKVALARAYERCASLFLMSQDVRCMSI
jgi:hypothetical protein